MASPENTQQSEEASSPAGGDEASLNATSEGKGMKVKTIRSRFMTTVLPIMIIPLLLAGVLAIAGLTVLGSKTTDAVADTEQIRIEHNEEVAEELDMAVGVGIARVNNFMDNWYSAVNNMSPNPERAEDVAEGLERFGAISLGVSQQNVQILFVDADGQVTSSSHPDQTLQDYGDAEWFQGAQDSELFRSFVNDDEHVPSFEFSRDLGDGNFVRVRVPAINLHHELDSVRDLLDTDYLLFDGSSNVLLGDTSTEHAEDALFNANWLGTTESGFISEAFQNGTIVNGFTDGRERVNYSSLAIVEMSAEQFPFADVQWSVIASQELDTIGSTLNSFQDTAQDVNAQQRTLSIGIALTVLLAMAIALFALRSAASAVSRPVEQLSIQAREAAEIGIPAIVEAARTSDELPVLDDFAVDTKDELSTLAASLNTMQDAAVDLAAGQAQLRRQNVSRTFVSLGRRNQNLLNRQLEFIEELESQERDADALENLFKLDHLATRMRRNAENLLVLAGEQTPRRWGKPIAIRDILRAASSEIADYRRVRLGEIEEATVSGNLATDLSHLFAELLENAGSFSPPTAPIEVFGQQTETHYRLAIVDRGIGMDEASLAQVNDRLQNPVDFADAPSAYIGLFVVGRLATDMGIQVRLANANQTGDGERRGTIAYVELPNALLSVEDAEGEQLDEKSNEAVARRADVVDAAPADVEASAGDDVFVERENIASTDDEAEDEKAPAVTAEDETAAEDLGIKETDLAKTDSGFPKRSKGATSVKTTPDKFESATPATAAEATAATPAAEDLGIKETDLAKTDSGFPKRSKGATSIKTTPDKFESDTPATADEVTAATPAEVTAATPAEPDVAKTDSGFPKRSKGATSIKTTPDKFESDTPATAAEAAPAKPRDPKNSAVAQVNKARAEARAAAAAMAIDGPTDEQPPEIKDLALPTTEAGFPKRGGSQKNSPLPAPSNEGPAPMRARDADHVKNSLMSYRAAVQRGRSKAENAEVTEAVATTASVGAGATNNASANSSLPGRSAPIGASPDSTGPDQDNDDVQTGSAQ